MLNPSKNPFVWYGDYYLQQNIHVGAGIVKDALDEQMVVQRQDQSRLIWTN